MLRFEDGTSCIIQVYCLNTGVELERLARIGCIDTRYEFSLILEQSYFFFIPKKLFRRWSELVSFDVQDGYPTCDLIQTRVQLSRQVPLLNVVAVAQ